MQHAPMRDTKENFRQLLCTAEMQKTEAGITNEVQPTNLI